MFYSSLRYPALGSFFAVFVDQVKEQNSKGDFFFRLINHSLACIECLEKGVAAKCVHQLKFIPPWKSLLRFTQMKALVWFLIFMMPGAVVSD